MWRNLTKVQYPCIFHEGLRKILSNVRVAGVQATIWIPALSYTKYERRRSVCWIYVTRILPEVRVKIGFIKKSSSCTISYRKITSHINVHIHTFRLRYFPVFKSILGKILSDCLRSYVDKKCKDVHVYAIKNTYGDNGVSNTYWLHSSTHSKPQRKMEVSGQNYTPTSLPLVEEPRDPLKRGHCGSQRPSRCVGEEKIGGPCRGIRTADRPTLVNYVV
jgi:hypothetical protein